MKIYRHIHEGTIVQAIQWIGKHSSCEIGEKFPDAHFIDGPEYLMLRIKHENIATLGRIGSYIFKVIAGSKTYPTGTIAILPKCSFESIFIEFER